MWEPIETAPLDFGKTPIVLLMPGNWHCCPGKAEWWTWDARPIGWLSLPKSMPSKSRPSTPQMGDWVHKKGMPIFRSRGVVSEVSPDGQLTVLSETYDEAWKGPLEDFNW